MFSELFSTLFTKEELTEFLNQVAILEDSLFNLKGSAEEHLKELFGYTHRHILTAYFSKYKIDPQNYDKLRVFLEEIKKEANALPTVSLSLSFAPSEKTIEKISYFIDDILKSHHIIDIHVEKSLIGGVIVSYKGRYKDFSLKEKIDEFFEKNKR